MVQLLTGASDPNGFMSNFIGSTMGTDAAGQGTSHLQHAILSVNNGLSYEQATSSVIP